MGEKAVSYTHLDVYKSQLHDREMIPQVVLDDDKRTGKSGAQASKQTAVSLTQKLLSSGIPTGHRPQDRKDVQAAAPMPDSAKQRSTDMVNLYKSRPVRSTIISSQGVENSINKPTVQSCLLYTSLLRRWTACGLPKQSLPVTLHFPKPANDQKRRYRHGYQTKPAEKETESCH